MLMVSVCHALISIRTVRLDEFPAVTRPLCHSVMIRMHLFPMRICLYSVQGKQEVLVGHDK